MYPIIEMGVNQWGWFVSSREPKGDGPVPFWSRNRWNQNRWNVKYLHPDGQWRSSMQIGNGKLGYFDSEEKARAALDMVRGSLPANSTFNLPLEDDEEVSIWEGI